MKNYKYFKMKYTKTAIQINGKKEADELEIFFNENNINWNSGDRFSFRYRGFSIQIAFTGGSGVKYSLNDWYFNRGYKIITLKQFLDKELKRGVYL